MHTTGVSFKAIGRQMGYHHSVVSRLVRKHTQTNNVKELPRSGRPRVTSDRDNRALQRLVRWMSFATSPVLKQHWMPNRHLSTRTVRNPPGTSCANHSLIGSSIASGMAAAIPTDIRHLTGGMRCRVEVVGVTPGTDLKMDMFYCKNWPCDIVIL